MPADPVDMPSSPGRLAERQLVIMVAFGLSFWLVVAIMIRFAPAILFARGTATGLAYALAVPVAPLSVWMAKRVAVLRPAQVVPGVALASASALLCDGIGLTWTTLYGEGLYAGDRLPAAAWLIWGAGLILLAAFLDARRAGA